MKKSTKIILVVVTAIAVYFLFIKKVKAETSSPAAIPKTTALSRAEQIANQEFKGAVDNLLNRF